MSIREKLKTTLAKAGAMCDDCLSLRASVKPRQQVNARCRELVATGDLTRITDLCPQCRSSKIINRISTASRLSKPKAELQKIISDTSQTYRPWYWEGNIQDKIVEHLKAEGWKIITSANTASREAGKDIVATKKNRELWVSVKGWPEKSVNTQARHWFSGALFDLVLYKDQNSEVSLAIGLPSSFSTYTNLIPRVTWLRKNLPFEIITVSEQGDVKVIQSTAEVV